MFTVNISIFIPEELNAWSEVISEILSMHSINRDNIGCFILKNCYLNDKILTPKVRSKHLLDSF